MEPIMLEIKNPKDRSEVARILIENEYRVCLKTLPKGTGSVRKTVVCAEKITKEGHAV